jgi:hypothetical protein
VTKDIVRKHGEGMKAGLAIRVGRPSVRPPSPEVVRRHRPDARARLANRLEAYLDLMSALEPARQAWAESPPRQPENAGKTSDRRDIG